MNVKCSECGSIATVVLDGKLYCSPHGLKEQKRREGFAIRQQEKTIQKRIQTTKS